MMPPGVNRILGFRFLNYRHSLKSGLTEWIAAWEEGVRYDLAGLATGGVIVGTEVQAVFRWHAWLTRSAAGVAGHNASGC